MDAAAVLITTAKVRAGHEQDFAQWQGRHDAIIAKFPGYISSDMMPGPDGGNEWTIVLNFRTPEQLEVWQKSSERAAIIAESIPLLEGGNFGEAVRTDGVGEQAGTNVTEVILSKIKPGMDDAYRAWTVKIQAAQARYPGYRGTYLQPPTAKDSHWTTLLRYDTAEHLENWMAAPERKALLEESKAFIESEELMRLATSFPGWVPINPVTGKGPPDWKTAMLVLLGLFPVVMLELRFLSPVLTAFGFHASLATFIGNALSVALTSLITMPLCVRWFGWWLFPADASTWPVTSKGVAVLIIFFALEILALWWLLPW
jgi:antibiotic biosynthesis monooxygenase (ABM) superfamily enzyme